MNREALENQFWALHGRFKAGRLDQGTYERECEQIRFQEKNGTWLRINPDNGEWLSFNGYEWVPEELVATVSETSSPETTVSEVNHTAPERGENSVENSLWKEGVQADLAALENDPAPDYFTRDLHRGYGVSTPQDPHETVVEVVPSITGKPELPEEVIGFLEKDATAVVTEDEQTLTEKPSCLSCGNPMGEGTFCPHCGSEQNSAPSSPSEPVPSIPSPTCNSCGFTNPTTLKRCLKCGRELN